MALHALSPLDGRYENETAPLRDFFSEFAYLRTRARLELDFLSALSEAGLFPAPASSDWKRALEDFAEEDARKIQQYEKSTRHDVKAIEYFLRERIPAELHPWIHFGLTSEDINNIAQALALKDSRDQVLLPTLGKELAVYLVRLNKCRAEIADHQFEAKLTGAVGNFNALQTAAPQVDWISFSRGFIRSHGLEPSLITTQ